MKKIITLILVCTMAISMVACGGKKESADDNGNSKPSNTSTPEVTAEATPDATTNNSDSTNNTPDDSDNPPANVNPVELALFPKTSPDAGAYATIKVSKDVKMDDETAWLGLCPEGKDYITELEADEEDVVWFNYEAREDGDPYVFSCDFSNVEDGTYALVVATSDDAEVGYVVIQLSMTKAGEELKFDFTNAKLNERPAK